MKFPLRISFPPYDTNYIMNGMVDLSKFYNIQINPNGPAIYFFHHYQRLIKDSRQEGGLDPFPVKQIGNLDNLIKAIAQIAKNIVTALTPRK